MVSLNSEGGGECRRSRVKFDGEVWRGFLLSFVHRFDPMSTSSAAPQPRSNRSLCGRTRKRKPQLQLEVKVKVICVDTSIDSYMEFIHGVHEI